MELPEPGQLFQKKYKLQDMLGRGGFAAVYRATDIEIGRDVAIKVLLPGDDDGYSEGVAARFVREARVIGGFQDPHTITMFEFGTTDDGLLFMVFEYVKGDDLSNIIKKRGALPQQEVSHIMKQVLQSLREAHAHGVLHRDIKPANILVYDYMGDANRVKLLDFGIAKAVAGGQDGMNLTREGAMIGTPRYMSPEQIYGGELDARSDLYSLGLVAHEMLVGSPAITGTTSKEMLRAQLADDPVRLPRGRVLATEAFCGVIDTLTARSPDQRFETAADVMQALDWVESQGQPPTSRSGGFAAMPVSGVNAPPLTPRSGEHMPPSEQSWERSGPLHPYQPGPHTPRQSGPIQAPPRHSGPMQAPPRYSGPLQAPPGHQPHPHQQHLHNHPYPPQHTQQGGPYRNPYVQDPTVGARPPTTERPITYEEQGADISVGTMVGAALGAAAVVVGVLMFVTYLSDDDGGDADAPKNVVVTPVEGETQPPTADADGTNTPPPEPARVDAKPKTGCNTSPSFVGESVESVDIEGEVYTYFVYTPKDYDKSKKHQVLLYFHDLGTTGKDDIDRVRLRRFADKQRLIIVAPDSRDVDKPWANNEAAALASVLQAVRADLCVDSAKTYALGYGVGAQIARDVHCHIPVSATALWGAGLSKDDKFCTDSSPVPTIRLHGKNDRYVPFAGGPGCAGGKYDSVDNAEKRWFERHGCSAKRSETADRKGNTCYASDQCDTEFQSCHLDGGHDWKTASPRAGEEAGCQAPPADYDVTRKVWRFFRKHAITLEED